MFYYDDFERYVYLLVIYVILLFFFNCIYCSIMIVNNVIMIVRRRLVVELKVMGERYDVVILVLFLYKSDIKMKVCKRLGYLIFIL